VDVRRLVAGSWHRLIPLANFGKRAQPVVTDESVRAACCSP
jgi:hypothetical protein